MNKPGDRPSTVEGSKLGKFRSQLRRSVEMEHKLTETIRPIRRPPEQEVEPLRTPKSDRASEGDQGGEGER